MMADNFERLYARAWAAYSHLPWASTVPVQKAFTRAIVLAILREMHAMADEDGDVAATDWIGEAIAQAEGGQEQ